ncbi:M20/M25/M40 family metallo-hydrolase [soil metagenome]
MTQSPLRLLAASAAALLALSPAAAQAPASEAQFRAIYKELIETNTTGSVGSCTLAAERMAARLKAAGFPDRDLHLLVPPDHPKDGNLVAVYPGTDPSAKVVLMLGHIDVVEARREDWTRDPFVLVEENGFFYGRGATDMKGQDAIWVDNLIRYRQEGFKPRSTIKMALTCGEEGASFNGATWLMETQRQLMDAGLALNEGGSGQLDAKGKPLAHLVQVAEKSAYYFTLEVTNKGGHASRPVPDNAIYHLVRAVDRISRYEFPVQFNQATRGYFTAMVKIVGGEQGRAMTRLMANPKDAAANALLSKDVNYHAILRTTCVATMLDAGHARNALPQRARATINCRIYPGETAEQVRQTLVRLAADPAVSIAAPPARALAPPPPLTDKVLGPIKAISQDIWPGVPVIPTMEAFATDAKALNAAGIPTYGVTGIFLEADGGNMHGLNENVRVSALMDARTFLYRLVKTYAQQAD